MQQQHIVVLPGFWPVGWKAWAACIVGGGIAGGVEEIVEQCKRYAQGADLLKCGGFLDYKIYSYPTNPYALINRPNITFE